MHIKSRHRIYSKHECFGLIFFTERYLGPSLFPFFFFTDTATTEIYTLSLHDALPICLPPAGHGGLRVKADRVHAGKQQIDRKSTRLNSSHVAISYAVFCLKKKNNGVESSEQTSN